jgi:tetratricopeptide (TPR) repeat protein
MVVVALLLCGGTLQLIRFEYQLKQATTSEMKQDWEAVVEQTRSALENGAFHHEAIHLQGYALNELERFDESVDLYSAALRSRPYDIQMHNSMAIAEQGRGNFAAAEAGYHKALAITPGIADLRYNLASLYFEQNRIDAAVAELDTMLTIPPSADLAYYAGGILEQAGRNRRARAAYRLATALRPTFIKAFLARDRALASPYLEANRPAEALAIYDSLLVAEGTNPYLQYLVGEARMMAKDPLKAIDAYAEAVRGNPDFAEAHLALGEGILQHAPGREKEAVAAFRAFVKLWKGDRRYLDFALNRIAQTIKEAP